MNNTEGALNNTNCSTSLANVEYESNGKAGYSFLMHPGSDEKWNKQSVTRMHDGREIRPAARCFGILPHPQ